MFVLMDQSYLSQFPQDAAYGYNMLGADPNSGMRYLYIDGDTEQFAIDFATTVEEVTNLEGNTSTVTTIKYTVPTTLPAQYIQTCVHEFIYGRTLTKAVIVAWQYSYSEENAVVRKRINAGEDTDEYLAYTYFVDSIPDDEGYTADIIGDGE